MDIDLIEQVFLLVYFSAIETVDSHSVVIKDDQMILFGGFN